MLSALEQSDEMVQRWLTTRRLSRFPSSGGHRKKGNWRSHRKPTEPVVLTAPGVNFDAKAPECAIKLIDSNLQHSLAIDRENMHVHLGVSTISSS